MLIWVFNIFFQIMLTAMCDISTNCTDDNNNGQKNCCLSINRNLFHFYLSIWLCRKYRGGGGFRFLIDQLVTTHMFLGHRRIDVISTDNLVSVCIYIAMFEGCNISLYIVDSHLRWTIVMTKCYSKLLTAIVINNLKQIWII